MAPRLQFWTQSTPFGSIGVVLRDGALVNVSLPGGAFAPPADAAAGLVRAVAQQFDEYFAGARPTFEIAVDFSAVRGPFARIVLERLMLAVPFGSVITYGELADQVGSPNAARAVGSAMRNNPVPIVVPCHRVVASTGLGGYGGEMHSALKRALLEHEGALVA